jgi:hypothetical protein
VKLAKVLAKHAIKKSQFVDHVFKVTLKGKKCGSSKNNEVNSEIDIPL